MSSASSVPGAGGHAATQKRLLIVEDECIVAFDLTVALQDMGYVSFGQRDSHAVGFILLDLDRFKQMNDTFGHAAGDAVLRTVADLLRSRIRIYDVACRYGGEEIVVVVPGESTAGAAALAEHLRSGIEALDITLPACSCRRSRRRSGCRRSPSTGGSSKAC
jgi:GGDEF domain-containing protein